MNSKLLVQCVHLPSEHCSTLLSPRHSHLLIALYSCPASLEQTPTSLRQLSDPSYELTKTLPLAISPQLFHSKLKTLLFNKSYADLFSSRPSLPVSTPNTIHHSRLTDSLVLTRCLSILFWISACE